VNAEAGHLPFRDESFATVLGADLFHHLDDANLATVLGEISRVLPPEGRLVAWWYERPGRDAPDAPRYPRDYSVVATAAGAAGFTSVSKLDLTTTVDAGPPTVGLVARV
jgi:ubiquinone/menaquinone biosynthesis C-methylase UbiE